MVLFFVGRHLVREEAIRHIADGSVFYVRGKPESEGMAGFGGGQRFSSFAI